MCHWAHACAMRLTLDWPRIRLTRYLHTCIDTDRALHMCHWAHACAMRCALDWPRIRYWAAACRAWLALLSRAAQWQAIHMTYDNKAWVYVRFAWLCSSIAWVYVCVPCFPWSLALTYHGPIVRTEDSSIMRLRLCSRETGSE